MQVLLLLAGRSRRFWPLEEKALWPMCGAPLLVHQISRLKAAGLTEITLVGGAHNLELARSIAKDLPVIEQEDLERGMQGALESALPKLKDEPLLVVSSNDVVDSAAYRAVKDLCEKNTALDGVLLAKRTTEYFPGGYIKMNGSKIAEIIEKPKPGTEPSDLVTIVVHAHRSPKDLAAAIKKASAKNDDGYERALTALFVEKNYAVAPYEGSWQPVKYPWHLLPLLETMLQNITTPQIDPTAVIHPSAVVEGPVIIGAGVRILQHATVVGPCVIGDRTIVGTGSLVRASSIGTDCVIGYSSEVARSVLADHVWTHTTYIGDSVIGENVSFGSGCITANLRLDESVIASTHAEEKIPTHLTKFGCVIGANSRLGVRVTIAPGVKIGGDSFISSGVMVEEDVPQKSFLRIRDGRLVVRENTQQAQKPANRTTFRKKL